MSLCADGGRPMLYMQYDTDGQMQLQLPTGREYALIQNINREEAAS